MERLTLRYTSLSSAFTRTYAKHPLALPAWLSALFGAAICARSAAPVTSPRLPQPGESFIHGRDPTPE